ncbi:MAG: 5-formyltetrahydrofolate cyclo-ligase [Bacteroidales bacterium]|nr:5-formyltetrahydrofolate cyclo-ligase [Bacteroidales bacterium]
MTTISKTSSEKAALRTQMRALSAGKVLEFEALASGWSCVESLPEFRSAQTILVYMALQDEVPTLDFIRKWESAKRIVLPVVDGNELLLREYHPELLSAGWKGILEPTASSAAVAPSEIDLALIPGLAFDLSGGRLGRGKGFYDRLLPHLSCPKIGICQKWRIAAQVPCEDWDGRVDKIQAF